MNKLEVGDTVRFLNTVGGGTVKGFQNKQIVIVEDENGFDFPVLISECVLIAPAGNRKLEETKADDKPSDQKKAPPATDIILDKPNDKTAETPEGEQITACLAYLPLDIKQLTTTQYECYFVNDSNYYLSFNYMSRENNVWISRYNGLVEPNTKIFLEEFDKTQLNEIEKVCVQYIAFKRGKPFAFKNPYSVELRIDTVKFYKLHAFQENDYFDDHALIYYITRRDVPEKTMIFSAGELKTAMQEKDRPEPKRLRVQKIEKRQKNIVTEIDLHIGQLVETTTGMSNADILNYQLEKFHETMQQHLHDKNHQIIFIHGKGDGVLKSALLKELRTKYKKCYTQDASFQEYGYGATMVTIK